MSESFVESAMRLADPQKEVPEGLGEYQPPKKRKGKAKKAKVETTCAQERKKPNRPKVYAGAMKVSLEQLIQAADQANGIVSDVARILNIDARTAKRYLELHPEAMAAFNDGRNISLDVAENELHVMIRDRNHPRHFDAVVFFLKTIGKTRGYTEKVEQEVTGKNGSLLIPPSIIIQPVKVKDGE